MKRLAYATLMIGVMSGSAVGGEWRFQRVEDAFQGDKYTAMVATGQMMAGFDCRDFFDMTFSFVTAERAKDRDPVAGTPTIAYIIDDQKQIEFEAKLRVGGNGLYFFEADEHSLRNAETLAVLNFARQVMKVKKRLAVAGKMNGQIIYSQNFDIAGSSKAVSQLLAGCKRRTDTMKGGRFPAEK